MSRLMQFTRGHLIALAYIVLASGLLFYAYRLETIAKDTNRILKTEVQEKDAEIASYEFMLNEQAVPAIVAMFAQIRKLGGDPPQVRIHPDEPPFVEQQKE